MKILSSISILLMAIVLCSCSLGIIDRDHIRLIESGQNREQLVHVLHSDPVREFTVVFTGEDMLDKKLPGDKNYNVVFDSTFVESAAYQSGSLAVNILMYDFVKDTKSRTDPLTGAYIEEKITKPYAFILIDDSLKFYGELPDVHKNNGVRIAKKKFWE